ncbi:type I toxin-antitoxin system Ibs family toxin, partial [Escherichia coli]|nr:type I toxin-antitoxin system Ibs family toxin [Escherichia coli]EHT1598967.1 type I toxin-antitoxin system Ibs family toxin [Escherichia coli]EHW3175003.1 type I toxin-antitoxin system Ibs family toxin [Escherichia coli]EHW3261813.1 type I toxin-antitoxin system Ibs family toxin [Escherichia coli]EHX8229538.1 type I toxin-antitoxin system Ibs family toxin [Escherichia coli]
MMKLLIIVVLLVISY